jgi:hypothetical protein
MPSQKLLPLLAITATLSTLAIYSSPQTALSMDNERQPGQTTAQNNPLSDRHVPDSWLPKCMVFVVGTCIMHGRKKPS